MHFLPKFVIKNQRAGTIGNFIDAAGGTKVPSGHPAGGTKKRCVFGAKIKFSFLMGSVTIGPFSALVSIGFLTFKKHKEIAKSENLVQHC